jgi:predicted esterase
LPRFFRRFAEGVFDLDDLELRAQQLARFVVQASELYSFDPANVIGFGYSNGANILHTMLTLHPESLSSAVLLRAMQTLNPPDAPNLTGKLVVLSEGLFDEIVPTENAEALAAQLGSYGANVKLLWRNGGHEISRAEILESAELLTPPVV